MSLFRSYRPDPRIHQDPIFTQLRMWERMRTPEHPILTIGTKAGAVYEGHLVGLVVRDRGVVVHLDDDQNRHHVIRVDQIEAVSQTRRARA